MGGIPLGELNVLELEFLGLLNFSLMVSPEELVKCGSTLLEFKESQLPSYRFGFKLGPKPVEFTVEICK